MAAPPETIGRYRIVQRLAQGGMGTLFLAIDPQIDRQVAIKLLRGELADDNLRERFVREARTAGRLRHPNIIAIFDIGEFDGYPFIAMEYIDGETLAEIIKRRAPLPVARKLEIVEALCSALSYAHRSGIVHRDVKPANVMIDREGVVKMLDFGIARLTGSGMTQQGAIMGTLNYMSPEQIEGRPADSRSDIFSAGAVLYELLSFRQAFEGDSIGALLGKILHERPAPLDALVDGLDAAIVTAVHRAMERDPAARYQTAEDMRRDLQAVRFRLAPDHHADALKPAPPPVALPATMASPAPMAAPAPRVGSDTVFLSPAPPGPRPASGVPDVQLLVVRSGDARMNGRVVTVRSGRFTIGRSSSCDLTLLDRILSRVHAVIEYGPDGFVVRDESSRNGTFLNGRRLKPGESEPLYFGATIQLGETVLSFTLTHDLKLPDLSGCQIAGRYSLRQLMHEGARGAVYSARDDNVAKDVAVKVLSPELMRFAGYREQFEREASVGATLHHPYICQVLDRGTAQLSPPGSSPIELSYLCMELMAGGTLQDRMLAGPIRLDLIAAWVDRLADALDYAHRHGVIHGDVKPSVIVFDQDEHVYLTEFAFAQRALNAGGGPAIGTPPYMAPEIWDHGSMTAASDQFALAVVTYYAVTGALPFAGQENPDVRRNNLLLGAVPAHKEAASYRGDAVPRGVSDVLARALARTPEQRFPSIREFATAVGAALQRRRVQGAAHVFLSYQRDGGSGWANYFAKELKDHGIATFLDVQQLDRAGQFPPRLARAIEECDVFVCILGTTTLQSSWVLEEIRQAHRHAKPMIPIFQEGFNPAAARSEADAAVDALLSYDAVHLFDVRNVHIQHSAQDLATLVKNTVARIE